MWSDPTQHRWTLHRSIDPMGIAWICIGSESSRCACRTILFGFCRLLMVGFADSLAERDTFAEGPTRELVESHCTDPLIPRSGFNPIASSLFFPASLYTWLGRLNSAAESCLVNSCWSVFYGKAFLFVDIVPPHNVHHSDFRCPVCTISSIFLLWSSIFPFCFPAIIKSSTHTPQDPTSASPPYLRKTHWPNLWHRNPRAPRSFFTRLYRTLGAFRKPET